MPGPSALKLNENYFSIYGMATTSAKECDLGMGRLSSRNPLICISIASYMFLAACSLVFPVATQPGRSGEYAE
jgi:hypothetical protein